VSNPVTSFLAESDFARADANLDEIVTQAVADHRIQLVGCRDGEGRAILISTTDMEMLLEGRRCRETPMALRPAGGLEG
jgi:hypothetical protein